MLPPRDSVREEESQSTVNLLTSSSLSTDCVYDLRERNYMGLSECSTVGSCTMSPSSVDVNFILNLKATELRLGLPGSHSPERNNELSLLTSPKIDEKPLFPLFSPQSVVSGSKRGFCDNEGMLRSKLDPSSIQESPSVANDTTQNHSYAANNRNTGPTLKEQVVGWPPIRSSFRKNTIVSGPKAAMVSSLYVKVSMDGAAYLRKVNLSTYYGYQGLTSALEEMFSCFLTGEYESQRGPRNEKQSETKQKHFLRGSEYVVTYVDKDDDWMLLGDVPWGMFIGTCKRLRILKSSEANGLGCGTKVVTRTSQIFCT